MLALLLAAALSGDVEGTVTLPDKAEQKGPRKPERYPGGGTPGATKRGPAIVFIDGVEGKFEPPKDKVTIGQKDRQFTPLALAVLKGTTVEFPNQDDEYHDVFSESSARRFELGRFPKGDAREQTFDKAGLVRLRCKIHTNMHAVVAVLENPCFAVCDEKGNFTIKGVPPGKYKMYAFHEDYEPRDKKADPLRAVVAEIEVTKEGKVKVDFDLRK